MRLVVLFLLAYEQQAHLGIAHHVLHLLLGAGGIERHAAQPDAVSAEVGVEILNAVLGKHADALLWFHSEIEQSV